MSQSGRGKTWIIGDFIEIHLYRKLLKSQEYKPGSFGIAHVATNLRDFDIRLDNK